MKIYTKTGDKGKTGLIGGKRVAKNHPRIDAYGTADELNSFIGVVLSLDHNLPDIVDTLLQIQRDLFTIGSILANPKIEKNSSLQNQFSGTQTLSLEREIDRYDKLLPPLANFILPGGNQPASFVHVARSVCRRLERILIDLSDSVEVEAEILKYINRLSDYLFTLSRYINYKNNISEDIWP